MPLVRRTRATLRRAEFGFLGVVVWTRVHTPRRCGLSLSAGVLFFATLSWRPLRTSCWIVGNRVSVFPVVPARAHARALSRSLLASLRGIQAALGPQKRDPATA